MTPPFFAQAATTAGLVLYTANEGLEVWDPLTGRVTCRPGHPGSAGDRALIVATHGDLLAWADHNGMLHLTATTSCADRAVSSVIVGNDRLVPSVEVASFSPDGRTLAVGADQQASGGTQTSVVFLVDVASAEASPIPGSAGDIFPVDAVVWSPDGQRLFWAIARPGSTGAIIVTWHHGDLTAKALRTLGLDLGPPLIAVPSA